MTIPSSLFTIGPEDGEYGGTVVAVIARMDTQVPFAILERTEDDEWKVLLNRGWTFVKGLKSLEGTIYSEWPDAVRDLEAIFDGTWEVSDAKSKPLPTEKNECQKTSLTAAAFSASDVVKRTA